LNHELYECFDDRLIKDHLLLTEYNLKSQENIV
jgi:hypothetical protein